MLEVGKLYVISERDFLISLFPNEKAAKEANNVGNIDLSIYDSLLKEELGPDVKYIDPAKISVILVVNISKRIYADIIAADQRGWIILRRWMMIKKL